MIIQDFYFNGSSTRAYGLRVVSFSSSANDIINGKQSLVTSHNKNSNRWHLLDVQYDSPLEFEMTLIPCNGEAFTMLKQRSVINWLCHKEYKELELSNLDYEKFVYNAIFYNPKIKNIGGENVGLIFNIAIETPYALSKSIEVDWTGSTLFLDINNDTEDVVFPNLIITMPSSLTGTSLKLTNTLVGKDMVCKFELDNLQANEVIKVDNENKILTSSVTGRNLMKDFNKNWFKLFNGENELNKNIPCDVSLIYRLARRAGIN